MMPVPEEVIEKLRPLAERHYAAAKDAESTTPMERPCRRCFHDKSEHEWVSAQDDGYYKCQHTNCFCDEFVLDKQRQIDRLGLAWTRLWAQRFIEFALDGEVLAVLRADVPQPHQEKDQESRVDDPDGPIPLSAAMLEAVKSWAANDRLWGSRSTTEFNLCTFARVILKEHLATASETEAIPACPHCGSGLYFEHYVGCRTLDTLKAERWWEVYDWCRDVQRLAQRISERVDEFANTVPDAKAKADVPHQRAGQDLYDDCEPLSSRINDIPIPPRSRSRE